MAKGIYVSATTPGSGKSLISLGLADTLHRHAGRIGFVKPVVHGHDAASALPVLVVPTDEERAIAEATAAVVGVSG
ncbi:BioD-like phosphotransacetylase family protein [Arthrobacter sp. UYCu723]